MLAHRCQKYVAFDPCMLLAILVETVINNIRVVVKNTCCPVSSSRPIPAKLRGLMWSNGTHLVWYGTVRCGSRTGPDRRLAECPRNQTVPNRMFTHQTRTSLDGNLLYGLSYGSNGPFRIDQYRPNRAGPYQSKGVQVNHQQILMTFWHIQSI